MKTKCTQHLFVAALVAGIFSACGKKGDTPLPAQPDAAANATNLPASMATSNPASAKLKGRWLRPDGGYIIEIRNVATDGKMDAGYFNPQPINVARAVALQEGGSVKVFIELRDVNYPGSTYRLSYDPVTDRLTGAYFQAVAQESYDVFFVRTKP